MKKTNKRLRVSGETIRLLKESEARRVNAGAIPEPGRTEFLCGNSIFRGCEPPSANTQCIDVCPMFG